MQTVKHWVLIFNEPWPLWPVATPATPSTALSGLPFCVSLGLWAEASKQCPQPCAVGCGSLEGRCEGCCSHKRRSAHLPW